MLRKKSMFKSMRKVLKVTNAFRDASKIDPRETEQDRIRKKHYPSLSKAQIERAKDVFQEDRGQVARLAQMLEKLSLCCPHDLDIYAEPHRVDPVSSYMTETQFLSIVNSLWRRQSDNDTDQAEFLNCYDAIHVRREDGEDEGEDSVMMIPRTRNMKLKDPAPNYPLLNDIMREAQVHDALDLERILRPPVENPEYIRAFKRLGAVKTDLGEYVLDSEVLMDRCAFLGLSDAECMTVVNLFDEDVSGEVDFDEFKRILHANVSQFSLTDTIVDALKRLLVIDRGAIQMNLSASVLQSPRMAKSLLDRLCVTSRRPAIDELSSSHNSPQTMSPRHNTSPHNQQDSSATRAMRRRSLIQSMEGDETDDEEGTTVTVTVEDLQRRVDRFEQGPAKDALGTERRVKALSEKARGPRPSPPLHSRAHSRRASEDDDTSNNDEAANKKKKQKNAKLLPNIHSDRTMQGRRAQKKLHFDMNKHLVKQRSVKSHVTEYMNKPTTSLLGAATPRTEMFGLPILSRAATAQSPMRKDHNRRRSQQHHETPPKAREEKTHVEDDDGDDDGDAEKDEHYRKILLGDAERSPTAKAPVLNTSLPALRILHHAPWAHDRLKPPPSREDARGSRSIDAPTLFQVDRLDSKTDFGGRTKVLFPTEPSSPPPKTARAQAVRAKFFASNTVAASKVYAAAASHLRRAREDATRDVPHPAPLKPRLLGIGV